MLKTDWFSSPPTFPFFQKVHFALMLVRGGCEKRATPPSFPPLSSPFAGGVVFHLTSDDDEAAALPLLLPSSVFRNLPSFLVVSWSFFFFHPWRKKTARALLFLSPLLTRQQM